MRNTARTPLGTRGTTGRTLRTCLAVTLGIGLLAACGGNGNDDDNGTGGGGDNADGGQDPVTLSIGVFGQFGLEEAGLYDEYMEANPHVTIEQTSTQRNQDYFSALVTRLPTGSGLMDIQAIEVANISEAANELGQYFVDLSDAEGVDLDHFIPWKVDQATGADGRVVGLGTDIGPMSICYRTDLFEQAGLPTDRNEVGALWEGDWQAYIDAGKEFRDNFDGNASWVDSGSSMFNAIVNSYPERFYNEAGEPVYQESEAVQTAWSMAVQAAEEELTGRHELFVTEWDNGMANGDFATLSCPAWMLGYIQDKSGGEGEGAWDVAPAPRPANWGGSFLGVTEASQNKEEAIKLITWLTAPEQQAKLFERRASFPSSAEAQQMEVVRDATHEYFDDAPIGELLSAAAADIPTLIVGPRDQVIQESLSRGVVQVEQGTDPDEAWASTVRSIENAIAD
ncbi:extracellular solute-binding protein [Streptomyces alkaliphilus]|uniref:Extracellular solute-binding protein n=1 Tax=Streptomyces alkaliphilus TaxID=1472722 RepID=A0A7W3Y0V7_9ACTN|nr:extracellular solute-binding protein [Streptomyces alkaliphilus]MBB0243625.1 extracellular solute-binding protein [Streptomyces alkaliphilus]